jgi:hypothetical protein
MNGAQTNYIEINVNGAGDPAAVGREVATSIREEIFVGNAYYQIATG